MKKSFILIMLSVLLLASCNFHTDDGTRSYTIYHYLENIEDDEYTLNTHLTQKFKANLGEETTAEALDLEGFVAQDFEQVIIGKKNNSVSIYYNRLVSTVTFNGNGGILTQTNDDEEENLEQVVITGKYGTPVTEPEFSRTGFIFNGWDKDLPESIPASDIELTGLWKAEITNNTYRYFVRPVQKFVNSSGADITENVCWDYRNGLDVGNQIIIWAQKESGYNYNQVFSFEPVTDKDNTYYIFTYGNNGNNYYLAENTKTYTFASSNTKVSIDGLCASLTPSKYLQFELVPVVSSEKPNEELFAIKISGTERYVTTGPSYYYYPNLIYMTCMGSYEPFLILDSLKTDEDGNIDDTQLFYLDNVGK